MDCTHADARIFFRDAYLIAAYKPYGVLSEAHEKEPNMPAILRELTGSDIYPVHRLDKTTEGLMLFAATSEAAAKLSAAIQRGEVQKTYLAVVEGVPDDHGELTDLLYFDRTKGKSYVVKRPRRGVKEARLVYDRLRSFSVDGVTVSEISIGLLTGRTHQIRVQFGSRKMPLVGDRRYGSRIHADEIALCAAELSFIHPFTGEKLSFSCTPENPIFSKKG